jgi:hypothetical protein
VSVFLSIGQAFEIARIVDRHGPVSIQPLPGGRILLAVATTPAPVATVALSLDPAGRITGRQRLDQHDPEARIRRDLELADVGGIVSVEPRIATTAVRSWA